LHLTLQLLAVYVGDGINLQSMFGQTYCWSILSVFIDSAASSLKGLYLFKP
ncbi:hypothetical protein GOP47_0031086, partial [Adiantum capillus-veneris]